MSDASSRHRLLTAAQRLFATHGYNGVSVRDIAREAGVNSASIGYYFGGKENLLAEVYRLSCAPIKAGRQRRFAELDKSGQASIADLVDAFVRPALASEPSGTFLHIRTILSAENAAILTDLTATNFDDSSIEFIERLATALPHLTRDQVFWRFHFLLCTIYYSASGPQRIAALSNNRCDPRNTDDLLQHLIPFLAAGLIAK
jgi:AcrR family transcriptional regulator